MRLWKAVWPYLIGVGGVLLAFGVAALWGPLREAPFLFFIVAVTVASALGGLGPGLVAIALSIIAVSGAFGPPPLIRVALFTVVTLVIVALNARQRRTGRALREAEHRYRLLFERLPIGLYRMEGGAVQANPALVRILGFPDRDSLQRTRLGSHYVDPADRERFRELLYRTGVVEAFSARLRRRDGSVLWARSSAHATFTAGGRLDVLEGAIRDITDMKNVEEELRTREAHFRALIEHAHDIITLVDAEGRILYESPAARAVLGYEPENRVGRSAFDHIHPDDQEWLRLEFSKCLHQPGVPIRAEFRARHRDGTYRIMEGLGTNALHDPAINGVIFNWRDVTERKQAEVEVQRQRESLFQAEKMAALGRLAAGIGHELKNPLTVLDARLKMLTAKIPDAEALARNLVSLRESSERMKRIIAGLSNYAKPVKVAPMVLKVEEVLRGTAELVTYDARKGHVALSVEAPASLPSIRVERSQFTQILVNLCMNAIEAMAPHGGGQLVLRASVDGDRVRIEIADTGPGIPTEALQTIWQPFYTTKAEGTGLGLSIVRGLVAEQPDATIDVRSEVGQGTTFTISMPVAPEPATNARRPSAERRDPAS